MAELTVPLLNRLVDAMLEHADSKADQNIWNLARAAEEVMREVKGEQLAADKTELKQRLSAVAEASGPPNHWAPRPGEWTGVSPTGRMQMAPIPLTFGGPPQPAPAPGPDYAAALGEVERRLMLKAPQYTGATTADKVDALAQDYQAAVKQLEQQNQGIELLKREMEGLRKNIRERFEEVREALDPDGQFEDESLVVLARERMNQRAARGQELHELKERIGTEIETNSAEMLRRVLGAGENETLGAAAKRVAESAKSGWEQYHNLNDLQNNQFHQLNTAVRTIVAAEDEFESDDHYAPEQPTTDAVRRVVARLIEVDRHPDGSRKSANEILDVVQDTWDGRTELPPFSWERKLETPKLAFEGPRYVVRKSSSNPDFDDWAVWDLKTGDWFVSVDVGSHAEAERRAAGLNETEDV